MSFLHFNVNGLNDVIVLVVFLYRLGVVVENKIIIIVWIVFFLFFSFFLFFFWGGGCFVWFCRGFFLFGVGGSLSFAKTW